MPGLTAKAQASLKVRRRLAGYAGRMIRYRRQNALTPEKDTEVSVNHKQADRQEAGDDHMTKLNTSERVTPQAGGRGIS